MQTDYNEYMAEAYAGMIVNSYKPTNILSRAVEETNGIDFGLGVVKGSDVAKQCALPYREVATVTFDADIITANDIDMTINGNAMTTVPFNTDHDTTMDDLKAEIDGMDGLSSVLTDTGGTNRVIAITVDHLDAAHLDEDALITALAVTSGATQAGSSVAYTSVDEFIGVTRHEHKMSKTAINVNPNVNSQVVNIFNKQAANVLNEGMIWVTVTEAVAIDDTAYIANNGANRGKFNKTSGINTTGKFKSATSGAGIAQLKIRLL